MNAPQDPTVVVDALVAAGWQVVGERTGMYKRLAVDDESGPRLTLVVPLDRLAGDYEDLMSSVMCTLETLMVDGQSAHQALRRISPGAYL